MTGAKRRRGIRTEGRCKRPMEHSFIGSSAK